MTIRQQGGVFGRNPAFNDLSANSASFTALTAGASSLGAITGTSFNIAQFKTGTNILESNVSGQNGARLRAAVSSAAFPTYSFTSDTNTGLYNVTADVLGVAVGGAEAGSFTSTGLAFPSGKGIDFSATSGTGTSELFDDYEEGTWTPTVLFYSGTLTVNGASYRKIGSIVHAFCDITFSATTDPDRIDLVSLPFAIATDASLANLGGGFTTYNDSGVQINFSANGAINRMQAFNNSGAEVTYTNVSGKRLRISFCYQSA